MKDKNLFIISNNTHLTIAEIYLEKYPAEENYVIIIIRSFRGDKAFIENIVRDGRWNLLRVVKLEELEKGKRRYFNLLNFFVQVNIIKLLNPSFKKVLFTSYYNWFNHYILKKYPKSEKILLSDGLSSSSIAEIRKSSKYFDFNISNPFFKSLLGLTEISSLTFFSQVPVKVAEGDRVEYFSYKKMEAGEIHSNLIYFIGSPLVETNLISRETHLSVLEKIKKLYPDPEFKIVYFAHRRESKANLSCYRNIMRVRCEDTPFEDLFRMEKIIPSAIISYYSTVLMNMYKIYPEIEVISIQLFEEDLLSNDFFKKKILNIYKDFQEIQEENFKLMKINKK